MKYTEEKYISEINILYPNEFKIISKYKGLSKPILIEDKFGVLQIKKASLLLKYKPTIMQALNKTDYFMNQLKYRHPHIAEQIAPVSEYVNARQKMLFKDKYGIVSFTPDNLMQGHLPSIRVAVDRKQYFKQQLLFIYGTKYDFIITSTDRHKGTVELICPIHGSQHVDSDAVFLGSGCPQCNRNNAVSNIFYFIELQSSTESFYKIGISHFKNGKIRRYKDYKNLGYEIKELYIKEFKDALQCKEFELKIKQIIKPFIYSPINWANNSSTECFSKDISIPLLNHIKYDIVSTSMEIQSSLISGHELTTHVEDEEI